MERRWIVAGLVIVLLVLSIVSTIWLVDPFTSRHVGPELDFSESSEEIAHDAMLATEWRDFTVQVYRGNAQGPVSDSVPVARSWHIRYDNTDKQALAKVPQGDEIAFTNPYFRWVRQGEDVRRAGSGVRPRDRFKNEELALTCDWVAVQSRNASTLVLAVNDTQRAVDFRYRSAQADPNMTARLTLAIDVNDGTLDRAVYRESGPVTVAGNYTGRRSHRRIVGVYSDWGSVDVSRPGWAGYSATELMLDIGNRERGWWLGAKGWALT